MYTKTGDLKYEELARDLGFRKNTKMAALTFIDDFILGIISSHMK